MKRKLLMGAVLVSIIAAIAFFGAKDNIKILSYTENNFGPVWVFEGENRRCMSFLKPPSAVTQSCMLLDSPKVSVFHYAQIFLGALFVKDQPKKILMLGLGGATVPKALNILVPKAELDIVEINPAIPPIVAKYFGFQESDKNHIFVEDGFEFVKNSPADVYDIVFLDAFTPDYIPPSFLTNEFMQNVKKILAKDGIVMMNTFTTSKFKEKEAELFKNNFGDYYNIATAQTKVMMASKNKLPETSEIIRQANLWRYRFVEVGVSQIDVLSLFEKSN